MPINSMNWMPILPACIEMIDTAYIITKKQSNFAKNLYIITYDQQPYLFFKQQQEVK